MTKDEALKMALEALCKIMPCDDVCDCTGQRAITAIKEALAQPEQEPVAWMYTSKWKGNERFITHFQTDLSTYKADEVWPLFTSPPKREWVGLTDEERINLSYKAEGNECVAVELTEDLLKEKNT